MITVDFEKCTGCGACLDVCSVEAISVKAGKAVIDVETCLECGTCIDACPIGAIVQSNLPVAAGVVPDHPVVVQKSSALVRPDPHLKVPWTRKILIFAGQEILPRVVDAVITNLERRFTEPGNTKTLKTSQMLIHQENGTARRRRRHRNRSSFRA